MLLLSLDNAVKVAKRLVRDGMDDDVVIRQELEQKCWYPPKTDEAAKHLNELISDINPAEISSQISQDNLTDWCNAVQVMMRMSMVELPCWVKEESDDKG